MARQFLRVTDVNCMNCVMRLERQEDDVSSVQRVRVSYSQDQVEVGHNEAVISAAQIAAAIR
jgi:copper chaperone CopZ